MEGVLINMKNIVQDFNNSLAMNSSDIIGDYMELGIDSTLDDGILKEIPIVKTVLSIGKISIGIRERKLIKNLVVFLNELNSGSIDKEELDKHKEMLKKNSKKAEKELGRILIILEQTIDNEKASILGKLYKAYINQTINWNMFVEYSEITNRLFVLDIDLLKILWLKDYNHYKETRDDSFRIERIYSLGIIGNNFPLLKKEGSLHGRVLNDLGKKYCDIIFEKNN